MVGVLITSTADKHKIYHSNQMKKDYTVLTQLNQWTEKYDFEKCKLTLLNLEPVISLRFCFLSRVT